MIGKHNREPHVFDSKNQTFRSVRLRFPLNESSPSLRPGSVLPKGIGVRPRARSAPHLCLMQQRSTRGSGGRVEAALQGAQGGRKMPWHGWVWRTIWVKKTSPIDSEHFPHMRSQEREPHCARAFPVESYMDISEEPFCMEIYRKNAGPQSRDTRFVRSRNAHGHLTRDFRRAIL